MHFCNVCRIKLGTREEFNKHLEGKKHRGKLVKQKIEKRTKNCTIYVQGIPESATEDQLKRQFECFGRVVGFYSIKEESAAEVHFAYTSVAAAALKSDIYIEGKKLMLSRGKSRDEEGNLPEVSFKQRIVPVVQSISNETTSVDDKLKSLAERTTSPDDELQAREHIARVVQDVVTLEIPGSKIFQFGSAVAGLALQGSDLDLHVQLPAGQQSESALQKVVFVLRRHPDFRDVIVLKKAKVPVMKFVHRKTRIHCDVTCRNLMGVQNSLLLRHLQELDPRIQPLLLILRCWAKVNDITGPANANRLSSYAFTLLAVFYLQQLDPPILGSIAEVMNEVPPEERYYCNGWNISFYSSVHKNRRTGNVTSLSGLVRGFFDFVGSFQFQDVVVCPLLGKVLPRSLFREESRQQLPEALAPYAQVFDKSLNILPLAVDKPLVVQDPQELSVNTTYQYSQENLEKLQKKCRDAASLCQKLREGHPEIKFSDLFPSAAQPSPSSATPAVSTSPTDVQTVDLKFTTACEMELEQRNLYLKCIANAMEELFEIGLMVVTRNGNTQPSKKRKRVDSKFNFERNLELKMPFNVWHGRAKLLKARPELTNLPTLAKERILTLLVREEEQEDPSNTVECSLLMSFTTEPSSVELRFTNKGPAHTKNKFNGFIVGLKQRINNIVASLLRELDIPILLDH